MRECCHPFFQVHPTLLLIASRDIPNGKFELQRNVFIAVHIVAHPLSLASLISEVELAHTEVILHIIGGMHMQPAVVTLSRGVVHGTLLIKLPV